MIKNAQIKFTEKTKKLKCGLRNLFRSLMKKLTREQQNYITASMKAKYFQKNFKSDPKSKVNESKSGRKKISTPEIEKLI